MARLTDEEIEHLEKKIGFVAVLFRKGYEEKKIRVSDVIRELKLRREEDAGNRSLSKEMPGEGGDEANGAGKDS